MKRKLENGAAALGRPTEEHEESDVEEEDLEASHSGPDLGASSAAGTNGGEATVPLPEPAKIAEIQTVIHDDD